MMSEEIYNAIGTTGGVILASALIPQIVLAHKRRSAKDISYMWQAIYITGLATLMVYYAHLELWPVLCPIAVECSCLVYLTGLKVYFERVAGGGTAGAPRPPLLKEADGTPGKSTSVNRLLESAVGVARSPKINPKMKSSVSEYGAVTSGHKTIQEA